MNNQRCFIVTVNGIDVARYKGNPGSAYQIATNHAYDIRESYKDKAMNGEPEYMGYMVAVNGRNIDDIIY